MDHSGVPRRTIAIIDDDPIVLETTQRILEKAGHRVICRDRAPGTVAMILKEKPDLVLLDVDMPDVSGDRIADIVRKSQPRGKTIILLYSGLPADMLRMKAIAAGAHGSLEKTGNPHELVRQVNGWLARGVPTPSQVLLGKSDHQQSPSASAQGFAGSLLGFDFDLGPKKASLEASDRRATSAPPPRKTSGLLRIETPSALFVDDDARMLLAYRRNVRRDDLIAEFTLYGEHAMRRILSDDPPDVVVSDVLMPDLNGVELYTRATEADPSWVRRFVFVTGASSIDRVSQFLRSVPCRTLHKPVDFERLSRAIRYSAAEARVFTRDQKQQKL